MRQPEVSVEHTDERDPLRPDVHPRRPQGVRGLQRVAPLHAPGTLAAPPDGGS